MILNNRTTGGQKAKIIPKSARKARKQDLQNRQRRESKENLRPNSLNTNVQKK